MHTQSQASRCEVQSPDCQAGTTAALSLQHRPVAVARRDTRLLTTCCSGCFVHDSQGAVVQGDVLPAARC